MFDILTHWHFFVHLCVSARILLEPKSNYVSESALWQSGRHGGKAKKWSKIINIMIKAIFV